MQRGEIWWAVLPEPWGRRPVALISRTGAIQVRNAATVAQVTTVIRQLSSEVSLDISDGVPKPCVINCDNLHTINKLQLERLICMLSSPKIEELDRALRFALGL